MPKKPCKSPSFRAQQATDGSTRRTSLELYCLTIDSRPRILCGSMRMLYLDDSGKAHPNDSSRFLVYAGISVAAANWADLHRRITGLKAATFPDRGNPNEWELKSKDFVLENAWARRKNRDFCLQLARVLGECECSVYVVAAEKSRAQRPSRDRWLVPLMFQRLLAKFAVEAGADNSMIVCDWGSYKLDHHISACVQSYAVPRGLSLIGGVTYASSESFTTIQVADLISAAFRHSYEGRTHASTLIAELLRLRFSRPGSVCLEGHPLDSIFRVF